MMTRGWLKQHARVRNWLTVVAWVVVASGAYIAATSLLLAAVALSGSVEYFSTTIGALVARVLLLLLMVAGLLLVIRSLPHENGFMKKVAGINRHVSWRDIGLALAGFVLYAIISMIVLTLASKIPGFNATETQQLGLTTLFGSERLVGFIVLVVITPFLEELLFRGLLFSKIRQTTIGFWPTALVVSLLFAVAHGQWNVGVDVFCLSMVACYLRESTGAIWAGILVHMLKNAIAFYFTFVLIQGLGS